MSSYLVESLSMIIIFFFIIIIIIMPKYPTNKSFNFTQDIETYTLKPHVIPYHSCANVLVSEQIKHVNSQLPKVSNKLKNPTLDHVFKILS